jgi:hypothetical protein
MLLRVRIMFVTLLIACALIVPASSLSAKLILIPDGGIAYQYPESHIDIIRVLFYNFRTVMVNGFGLGNPTYGTVYTGCLDFVNQGPQVITDIVFTFWPKGSDNKFFTLHMKNPIPVGVPQINKGVGPSDRFPPYINSGCAFAFAKGVWVSSVTYADGSTWTAPSDAPMSGTAQFIPPPTAAPSPSGT